MEFVLYSYYRSSASFRVRIALNLKKINYEYKSINLIKNGGEQHGPEYKKLNPLSQVPCLIHNGKAITQSVAIIDYLDSVVSSPQLFPTDPLSRATVLQLCEVVNSGIQPLQNTAVTTELEKSFGLSAEKTTQWRKYWIERGLTSLEEMYKKTAKKYSFGDTVTAADCFLVPQIFSSQRFGADVSSYKTLLGVYERLMVLEAFQRAEPSKQPDAV